MSDQSPTMLVNLVLKTPNQKLPDQTFSCQAEWKVLDLKKFLQQHYPNNPKPEDQRLIYSGRLLSDSEILKDFLRDLGSEQTHTIHLVYVPKKETNTDNRDSNNMQKVINGDAASDEGLRRRNVPVTTMPLIGQQWVPNTQFPVWGGMGNQGADPMTQQLLWWQQTYAQQAQYWAQYMHHISNSNWSTNPPTAPTSANAAPAPVSPPPAEVDPRPQEQRRVPVVVGLAAAAQEDEDDGGIRVARDWLDWIYVGSRLAILLAVMYYYSSLSRFILVTIIVAGIYLYQKTIGRRLGPANNRADEVNNNVNGEAVAGGPGEGVRANDGPEALQEGDVGPGNQPHVPTIGPANSVQPNTSPNALNVALNLLVGFFTSLIPDVPAPEALN